MPSEAKKEVEAEEELQIEIDESDDSSEPEAVVEPEPKQEEDQAETSSDDDEIGQFSEKVQKRINKMTARLREAQRREAAALDYAKGVNKQLEESTKRTMTSDESFVNEFQSRVTAEEQLTKAALSTAIDRGDVEAQVEAQNRLAKIAQDNERLNYIKVNRENAAKAPAAPVAPAPPAPVRDANAEAWAAKKEWFGTDKPMTLTAFSIHNELVNNQGFQPDVYPQPYYAELERQMKENFPDKYNKESPPNKTTRKAPAVGGATRGSGRISQNKVTLTKSQVAIAQKLGITNEQYAKQLIAMQKP